MRFNRINLAFAFFASVSALLETGCGFLDSATLSPRTYSVNTGSDVVLNNAMLLNVVRASYSEPLNFITIAKYTAGDQLMASGAVGPFTYAALAANPSSTYGPGSLNGQVSNSFDLNSMDTKDFYQGMLQPLDPIALELWFRQGFPRALVFYLLLDSIRVSTSDGVYEYKNDPADDQWTEGTTRERTSQNCQPKPTGNGHLTNYDVDTSLWHGLHGEDCRFQKFRHFVSLAVKYGLRLEKISQPGSKAKPTSAKPSPTALATPSSAQVTISSAGPPAANAGLSSSTTDASATSKTQICYDPAVLRARDVPPRLLPDFTTCGQNKLSTKNQITLSGIGTFRDTEFVMRSGFGVFQYLGRVLATNSMESLTLGPREYDVQTRDDDHLLTVVSVDGSGCFATAWYRSSLYCVPSTGAENTKLIFTMLRAIVATNVNSLLLNSTATVRVTP
jgi:hypothetical protein